jgi:hypothetical protein
MLVTDYSHVVIQEPAFLEKNPLLCPSSHIGSLEEVHWAQMLSPKSTHHTS